MEPTSSVAHRTCWRKPSRRTLPAGARSSGRQAWCSKHPNEPGGRSPVPGGRLIRAVGRRDPRVAWAGLQYSFDSLGDSIMTLSRTVFLTSGLALTLFCGSVEAQPATQGGKPMITLQMPATPDPARVTLDPRTTALI